MKRQLCLLGKGPAPAHHHKCATDPPPAIKHLTWVVASRMRTLYVSPPPRAPPWIGVFRCSMRMTASAWVVAVSGVGAGWLAGPR